MDGAEPIYYRFVINTRRTRTLIRRALSRGVVCDRPIVRPLHVYLKQSAQQFPNTGWAWRNGASIPLYPALTDTEVAHVTTVVREAVS